MKNIILIVTLMLTCTFLSAKEYEVYGPQGGLAIKITLPKGFDVKTDKCPMVILMHGIFASKTITPLPAIAKSLADKGIASIRFNFGGHWSSEGKIQKMTIENEIADAMAIWEYANSLPYVTKIGMLGHSQGGVVASMTAGRISAMNPSGKVPYALVLVAPASVLKNACNEGRMLGAEFDPINPPEYIKCFGMMKVSREYILTTRELDIYGTAATYKGPVKIIHGNKDKLVPLWCSEDFKKTYRDASDLIVVEGEDHRISRKTRKVAEIIAGFFNEF